MKAQEWAAKVGLYVGGKLGLSDVQVGVEVYGSTGRIYWIGREESPQITSSI